MNIVLVAINAKYIHSNLAVYSLKAYAEKYAKNENIEIEIKGRHDPIIVPRAIVVVEAMSAIALTDMLFRSLPSQIDKIKANY